MIGLQLALATDRISALALSGFPPLDGPYPAMLRSVRALSGSGGVAGLHVPPEVQAEFRQFVTYYDGLVGFDDRAAQARLSMPRLYFVGRDDVLPLGEETVARFGDTGAEQQAELEDLGWEVVLVPGRDHGTLIDPDVVLPVLTPFLERVLLDAPR